MPPNAAESFLPRKKQFINTNRISQLGDECRKRETTFPLLGRERLAEFNVLNVRLATSLSSSRTERMKPTFIISINLFMLIAGHLGAEEKKGALGETNPAFVFSGVDYFHRWSLKDQHEFTPAKQDDLKKWSEMMTVNLYRDVHDGEQLASIANAVLENYKKHQAIVMRTNSLPRTPDRPAEHFIAVAFPQHDFIEVAFARLKLIDGMGSSCVFSHRIYGEKVGDQMSAWLKANAPAMEKALMEWTAMPAPASLK